jgi:hypothetical protein
MLVLLMPAEVRRSFINNDNLMFIIGQISYCICNFNINFSIGLEQRPNKRPVKFLKPFGSDIIDLVMWLRNFAWDLCPQALTNRSAHFGKALLHPTKTVLPF